MTASSRRMGKRTSLFCLRSFSSAASTSSSTQGWSWEKPTVNQSTIDRGPLVAMIEDVVGGQGLLAAAGFGFEKSVELVAVVKGMEHRRKGGNLNIIRRACCTPLQQRAVNAQQVVAQTCSGGQRFVPNRQQKAADLQNRSALRLLVLGFGRPLFPAAE